MIGLHLATSPVSRIKDIRRAPIVLMKQTAFIWKNCGKIVYMGHRWFLPLNHPLRKKGKHFKEELETCANPMFHDGKCIFLMIKDVLVVFGKLRDSQQVPNDENGHALMWKRSLYCGSYLLESPGDTKLNWFDALNKESLREPAKFLGYVWVGKRYLGSKTWSKRNETTRRHAS